jgi:hypothetical protein
MEKEIEKVKIVLFQLLNESMLLVEIKISFLPFYTGSFLLLAVIWKDRYIPIEKGICVQIWLQAANNGKWNNTVKTVLFQLLNESTLLVEIKIYFL